MDNVQDNIKRLEKHFQQFEGRFDSHLEVYRNNGKEMATLSNEIVHLREDVSSIKQMIKDDIVPISKRLSALENWRWYILGGAVVLIAIGGAWLDTRIANVVASELDEKYFEMTQ